MEIQTEEGQCLQDMPDAEFRKALAQVGEWVANYRLQVARHPVLSTIKPGAIRSALPAIPPMEKEAPEDWLRDLDKIIIPGVTHWNHPGFMAYFGLTGSGPGILGELVAATLNVNGMLWKTSPACTELEEVVVRWYAVSMGLPADWFGMISDTASTSTLVALAAAREAAGLSVREEGLSGKPPLVLYCSEEAHSSVDKAGLILGVGTRGIRHIPSDESYRMNVEILEDEIRKDRERRNRPFAVVATVGTTSATAVDPVPQIAEVCRKHGLWLHVDAAYAGTAAIAPRYRWALEGCDKADSLVANPHKWLFTPIDCSVLFTRHPAVFRSAFSLIPEYLRSQVEDTTDLMDYSFQLGRRFRALKLWFIFRYFGTRGIADRICQAASLAQEFSAWVDAHPDMERLAPAPFSVVCFRVHPRGVDQEGDLEKLNARVLEQVNADGRVFLSHTKLKGRYCLRLAVGNLATTGLHLRLAFELVREAAGIRPGVETHGSPG
jgi:aromatic-L-amino-acid decarboxylase